MNQRLHLHRILCGILLSLSLLASLAAADSHESFFLSSTIHCEEMVQSHTFQGTCCSLEITPDQGCKLTVAQGWCRVHGPTWTLELTSEGEEDCPPSDYVFSAMPSATPTRKPSLGPTRRPSLRPSLRPTTQTPTERPTSKAPTERPTSKAPTERPTSRPTNPRIEAHQLVTSNAKDGQEAKLVYISSNVERPADLGNSLNENEDRDENETGDADRV